MENAVERRLARSLPGALELLDWKQVPEHRQVAEVKWHWKKLRQGIRSDIRDRHAQIGTTEDRYYVTNLLWRRLSFAQWAKQIRSHWLVENAAHATLDVYPDEGHLSWTQHPNGVLAIALLRRLALSFLNPLRSHYLRSEASRATPWRELMEDLCHLLRLPIMDDLLRPRRLG